jgi:hypothetical protein
MKTTEYKTASGKTLEELDARVNGFIKEGFQPYAAPYSVAAKVCEEILFCQAMIKVSELQQQKPKLESPAQTKTP